MKFLCTRSFEHSGVCGYTKGTVYAIAVTAAAALAALDKTRKAGALEFFTPVDAEASEFMQSLAKTEPKGGGVTTPQTEAGTGNDAPPPKPPTKAELTAEAQALGIALTGKEKNADILVLIEAAKAAKQTEAGTGEGGKQ